MYTDLFISHTQKWITDFVIHLDLCPYASECAENSSIRYVVSTAETAPQLLQQLQLQSEKLAAHPNNTLDLHNATLLIHPYMPSTFAEQQVIQQYCDKHYQPVTTIYHLWFHPNYLPGCTQNNNQIDASAYIKRAPYPTILLYKASAALYEEISTQQFHAKNISKTTAVGIQVLDALLAQCSTRKSTSHP